MFDDVLSGPQTILEYCGVNHTHLFIVKPFLSGQGPFNPQLHATFSLMKKRNALLCEVEWGLGAS